MATEEQQEAERQRLVLELENGIRTEILRSTAASSDPLAPGEVADRAFGLNGEVLVVLYPHLSLEVARRRFHRHWVRVICRMAQASELRITSRLDLAPGCRLPVAA